MPAAIPDPPNPSTNPIPFQDLIAILQIPLEPIVRPSPFPLYMPLPDPQASPEAKRRAPSELYCANPKFVGEFTPTLPNTVNSLSVDESPKNAAPSPLDFKLRVAATLVFVKVRV